jgi:hypothetical protein
MFSSQRPILEEKKIFISKNWPIIQTLLKRKLEYGFFKKNKNKNDIKSAFRIVISEE